LNPQSKADIEQAGARDLWNLLLLLVGDDIKQLLDTVTPTGATMPNTAQWARSARHLFARDGALDRVVVVTGSGEPDNAKEITQVK
jgi:hypothetical protein